MNTLNLYELAKIIDEPLIVEVHDDYFIINFKMKLIV